MDETQRIDQLATARQNFIQGMSRVSHFWGFSKAMGAIYGAIYLSPQPVSLDDLVEQVGVTKGAVSTNVRTLERLGMVHKHLEVGDRKDYYTAETDFWKIARGMLREREKQEFDQALRTVGESLELAQTSAALAADAELAAFYRQRMGNMQDFFNNLDNLVAMLMALDNLRSGTLSRLFGNSS
jgi:DNA-binding transcriptional regulator GbsR (MarR family)